MSSEEDEMASRRDKAIAKLLDTMGHDLGLQGWCIPRKFLRDVLVKAFFVSPSLSEKHIQYLDIHSLCLRADSFAYPSYTALSSSPASSSSSTSTLRNSSTSGVGETHASNGEETELIDWVQIDGKIISSTRGLGPFEWIKESWGSREEQEKEKSIYRWLPKDVPTFAEIEQIKPRTVHDAVVELNECIKDLPKETETHNELGLTRTASPDARASESSTSSRGPVIPIHLQAQIHQHQLHQHQLPQASGVVGGTVGVAIGASAEQRRKRPGKQSVRSKIVDLGNPECCLGFEISRREILSAHCVVVENLEASVPDKVVVQSRSCSGLRDVPSRTFCEACRKTKGTCSKYYRSTAKVMVDSLGFDSMYEALDSSQMDIMYRTASAVTRMENEIKKLKAELDQSNKEKELKPLGRLVNKLEASGLFTRRAFLYRFMLCLLSAYEYIMRSGTNGLRWDTLPFGREITVFFMIIRNFNGGRSILRFLRGPMGTTNNKKRKKSVALSIENQTVNNVEVDELVAPGKPKHNAQKVSENDIRLPILSMETLERKLRDKTRAVEKEMPDLQASTLDNHLSRHATENEKVTVAVHAALVKEWEALVREALDESDDSRALYLHNQSLGTAQLDHMQAHHLQHMLHQQQQQPPPPVYQHDASHLPPSHHHSHHLQDQTQRQQQDQQHIPMHQSQEMGGYMHHMASTSSSSSSSSSSSQRQQEQQSNLAMMSSSDMAYENGARTHSENPAALLELRRHGNKRARQ